MSHEQAMSNVYPQLYDDGFKPLNHALDESAAEAVIYHYPEVAVPVSGFQVAEDIGFLPEYQPRKLLHNYDQAERSTVLTPLAQYLREIGKHALLDGEEEILLAKYIEIGQTALSYLEENDQQLAEYELDYLGSIISQGQCAEKDFINANLRLVVNIAKRYRDYRGSNRNDDDFMDVIQAGNIGLQTAVEKFEWRKGYKFSTYATWWIKQSITKENNELQGSIHIPLNKRGDLRRLEHIEQGYIAQGKGLPDVQVLAEEMNFKDPHEIENLRQIREISRVASLQPPSSSSEAPDFNFDNTTVAFQTAEKSSDEQPHNKVVDNDSASYLETLLEKVLEPEEKEILCLYYGIGEAAQHRITEIAKNSKNINRDELSVAEIAKIFNRPNSEMQWRIHQIREKVKHTLQKPLLRLHYDEG